MTDLQPVDPTTIPYLQGRFEPVHREIDTTDVTIDGEVPADLAGTYLRNGPNAKYAPLGSYLYPMEGDGMVHSVQLGPDGVHYRNRWVRTQSFEADVRAGRAVFGGLMTPSFPGPELTGPNPDPTWPYKEGAFINIVRHADRYLALDEGAPPYEVTAALDTVGRVDFDGALPNGITAHPKIDPVTGEMIVFRYDVSEPFLTWAVLGADGSVVQPETPVPDVDVSYMIHDCAITEQHLVLVLAPMVIDLDAMTRGGSILDWRPQLGCRIAVIARDGSGVQWVETDPFWVWHYANAHLDGSVVVMDYPEWNIPGAIIPDAPPVVGNYVRARIDVERGTFEREVLHDGPTEFPRIDERRLGRQQRYSLVTGGSGDQRLVLAEHDVLCRVDLQTAAFDEVVLDGPVGEPVFAPRPGGTEELDGWYLAFVTTFGERHSSLCVWDAAAFPDEPIARIHLPQRVPNGLHGHWFPAG
ncbi:MAG TPA: carotenoid oxygenase family protein [Acidimicrobiales bacterium]